MNENNSPNMTPERWHRAGEIYADALERSAGEARDAFAANACGDDHALLQQVRSLLAEESRAYDVLSVTQVQGALGAVSKHDADKDAQDDITRWYGKRFGAYRITEEIARGGMGSVFKAVRDDDQYHKDVAVKIIRPGMDTRLVVTRFKAERQILASLDHPNIARLIDGGTTEDSVPFFVMDYVDGQSIDDYCKNKNTTLIERLQLFRTVCSAVHFAHQRLVVHRDLKPSNILVDTTGQVKLLDFGIAKLLDPTIIGEDGKASAAPTVANAMTPAYASPEQIKGEAITTASDVYALGVVLYRLLTGRSPYKANNTQPLALAKEIVETDPEKPSTVVTKGATSGDTDVQTAHSTSPAIDTDNVHKGLRSLASKRLQRNLSGDLDNIVLMALRKDPTRRYASAEQLSEDVKRYLENKPVSARADTFTYRATKFVQRNVWSTAFAALAFVGLSGGLVATAYQVKVARESQASAQKNFEIARKFSNSTIDTVMQDLRGVNGTQPLQRKLMAKTVEQLEALRENAGDDARFLAELGKGYSALALTQGSFGEVPIAEKLANQQKADDLLKRAHALSPKDVGIASALLAHAASYSIGGTSQAANRARLLEAVAIGRTIERTATVPVYFQRQLASAIGAAGTGNYSTLSLHECLPLLLDEQRRLEALLQNSEAVTEHRSMQYELSSSYFRTAVALFNSSMMADRVAAQPYANKAIEAATKLVKSYPDKSSYGRVLGGYLAGRAIYFLDMKRFDESLADVAAARALIDPQMLANPGDKSAVALAYSAELVDADVSLSQNNIARAKTSLEIASKYRDSLGAEGAKNINVQSLMNWAQGIQAELNAREAENISLTASQRKALYQNAIITLEQAADWYEKNRMILERYETERIDRFRATATKNKQAMALLR
jgi:eukaryotic-like serine/threonine-protein kinase